MAGELGLLAIKSQGQEAIAIPLALSQHLSNPNLALLIKFFSVFALITSVLGVCLSLFDFIQDVLTQHHIKTNKSILLSLTFIPPMIFVLFYPNAFTSTLSFAGSLVAILLGLLPCLLVASQRRIHTATRQYGGRILLTITGLFFITIVFFEIINLNWGH